MGPQPRGNLRLGHTCPHMVHMVGLREGRPQGLSALKLQESFISSNKSRLPVEAALQMHCSQARFSVADKAPPSHSALWLLSQNAADTGRLSSPSTQGDRACITQSLKVCKMTSGVVWFLHWLL